MQLRKLHIHTCSREGASSCGWSVLRGFLLSLAAQSAHTELQKATFSYVRMLVKSFSHQPVCTFMPCGKMQQNYNVNNHKGIWPVSFPLWSTWRPKSARLCEPPPLETCSHSCSVVSWHSVRLTTVLLEIHKVQQIPNRESKMRLYPHMG